MYMYEVGFLHLDSLLCVFLQDLHFNS
uniref:Uncharacterized protein n=1 Tax=Anguilla anguilla TaxID=7936 RepID=A0A0E9STT8_ANGAN